METCHRALQHVHSDSERLHTLLSLLSSALDMRHWAAVRTTTEQAEQLLPGAQPHEAARAQALQAHAAYYQGHMHRAHGMISACQEQTGCLAHRATVLNTKGMIETALGEYESAGTDLAEAASIADEFGDSLASHIDDNVAYLEASVGRFEAALARLRRLSQRKDAVDPTHRCIVHMHEGTSLRRMGNPREALEPTRIAIEAVSVKRDAYLAYNARANLAFSHALLSLDQGGILQSIASDAARAGLPFVQLKGVLFAGIAAHVAGDRLRGPGAPGGVLAAATRTRPRQSRGAGALPSPRTRESGPSAAQEQRAWAGTRAGVEPALAVPGVLPDAPQTLPVASRHVDRPRRR